MKKKEWIATVFFLLLDQGTKWICESYLSASFEVIPGFFQLEMVYNTGGAWSILQNQVWLFVLVGFLSLLLLASFKTEMEHLPFSSWIYSLLYAGIIGNLLDRIVFHHVKDFLSFQLFGHSFPVFNFADIFIVLGSFLFLLGLLRGEKNGKNCSRRRKKREN